MFVIFLFYFTFFLFFKLALLTMGPPVGVSLLQWTLCELEHSLCLCGVNILKYTVDMDPSVPVLSKLWYRTIVFLVDRSVRSSLCTDTVSCCGWLVDILCLMPPDTQFATSTLICPLPNEFTDQSLRCCNNVRLLRVALYSLRFCIYLPEDS